MRPILTTMQADGTMIPVEGVSVASRNGAGYPTGSKVTVRFPNVARGRQTARRFLAACDGTTAVVDAGDSMQRCHQVRCTVGLLQAWLQQNDGTGLARAVCQAEWLHAADLAPRGRQRNKQCKARAEL